MICSFRVVRLESYRLFLFIHKGGEFWRDRSASPEAGEATAATPKTTWAAHTGNAAALAEHRAKALESTHLADLLHRAGHFLVHLEHLVDLLHRRARPVGDTNLALRGQDFGLRALLGGHRPHDRVEVDEHLVVGGAGGHLRLRLLDPGDHAGERTDAAHAAHLVQLGAKVVEVD